VSTIRVIGAIRGRRPWAQQDALGLAVSATSEPEPRYHGAVGPTGVAPEDDAMQPKFNVWLEKDGKVVLSPWRVRLLETIEATGSISAAAEALDLPYRRAWEKVHEIEVQLGSKVLDTAIGGAQGGGARLTESAKHAIAQFHAFADGLEVEVGRRYRSAFRKTSPLRAARTKAVTR